MIYQSRFYPQQYEDPHFYEDAKDATVYTPGNGIAIYTGLSKIVGIILVIFKKAIFVQLEGKSIIINSSSYSKFLLRAYTLVKTDRYDNFEALQIDMQKEYQKEKSTTVLSFLSDAAKIQKQLPRFYKKDDFINALNNYFDNLQKLNLSVDG